MDKPAGMTEAMKGFGGAQNRGWWCPAEGRWCEGIEAD